MMLRIQTRRLSVVIMIFIMVLFLIIGCSDQGLIVPAPNIEVSGTGLSRTITITSSKSDTFIYYTTDGTTPALSSTLYVSPIKISGIGVSRTIRAINLYLTKYSEISTRTVTIDPAALNLIGAVTTLAGSTTSGSSDGVGDAARFFNPYGITTDGTNLYVADCSNNLIRKIVISTGAVTTLAGSTTSGSSDGVGDAARFFSPTGITTDGTNLYVTDRSNNLIRKIVISTGAVTTLAGSTTSGSSDGVGDAARFFNPTGITTDGTNLFVVDNQNFMIRKIVISTGAVTTLAGATTSGSSDGIGTAARFFNPVGITTDGTNLYVADADNHMIRKIVISSGAVTTLAGSTTSGSSDGLGASARFNQPVDIATDGTNLYVTDWSNNLIRKIVISTGAVTTLAGSTTSGSSDGVGDAARFFNPYGITTDGTNLFVSDHSNNLIRKVE